MPYKYAADTWRIYDKICVPEIEEGVHAWLRRESVGKVRHAPCDTLDWMTYDPCVIPVADFYKKIHVLIHKTGGSRENLPRAMMEAWNAGVVSQS
jgi:hypothetical protein